MTMEQFFGNFGSLLTKVSDLVCGYPFFLLLVCGGLFFFVYSGGISIRRYGSAIKALRYKQGNGGAGQISSFQALMSEISSTVGMGSIAGVAIALCMGGPGAIFWMWVSAVLGMCTKFFEGALSIMYKGKDSAGEVQGGPMYIIINGLGRRWKPMAYFFAVFALIGTLCFMQSNQLVEAITTVITTPMGIENTLLLRFLLGVVFCAIVASVILGGITRISRIATKIVPTMVGLYFLLVFVIIVMYADRVPGVFAAIFHGAFNLDAGIGGLVGTTIIGFRRAAYVNEAGVGTTSLMHGASRNDNPIREGLVTMIGPSIDSGLVCTLTAVPIIIAGNYAGGGEIKGLYIALNSFDALLPGCGHYLLMVIVLFFAFSTMFSYSYYGLKCTNFLFGAHRAKYYNYFYLVMIIVAAMIPLGSVVALMDLSFALMAFPNMIAIIMLAPRVKSLAGQYFARNRSQSNKTA